MKELRIPSKDATKSSSLERVRGAARTTGLVTSVHVYMCTLSVLVCAVPMGFKCEAHEDKELICRANSERSATANSQS